MKKFKKLISIFLIVTFFFLLLLIKVFASEASDSSKIIIPKQSQFGSVISNTGESIIYGSVLDLNNNIANIIVSDEVLDAIKQLGDRPIKLYSNSGLIGRYITYDLIRSKNIKKKKIRGKTREYIVINLGSEISPSELPSDDYRFRIDEDDVFDVTTEPFTYEPSALIVGRVISNQPAIVSIEDLNGNRLSEGIVTTGADGSFITEVRANKITPELVVAIHAITNNKDLYTLITLTNDHENNEKVAANPIEVSEATTLTYNLAKGNEEVKEEITKEEESEKPKEKPEEELDNQNLSKEGCEIDKFANECDLENEEILAKIGKSFKEFLETAVCQFKEFELIKKVILATSGDSNIDIGRGYCEHFGRKEEPNKPCEVYAQILKEFKAKHILGLPCPPEFCKEFKDIRPPKCFDVNDFCEEKLPTRILERICRGKRCFDPPPCIVKPKKDLFCAKVGVDIKESECTENKFTIIESKDGVKYCVPNNSDAAKLIEECELKDCHKKCEEAESNILCTGLSGVADEFCGRVSNKETTESICEEGQISSQEKPCTCARNASLLADGRCICGVTTIYTKEGCKRFCGPGGLFTDGGPCECEPGAKFSGTFIIGEVDKGKHTIELEAEGKEGGSNLGTLADWNGTAIIRPSVDQCDFFPTTPCATNKFLQNVGRFCEGTGQICSPRSKFEIELLKASPLEFEFEGGSHCSSIRLNIYIDGKLTKTTPFLGYKCPGFGSDGPLKIGGRGVCKCPEGGEPTEKGCPEKKEEPVKPIEPTKPVGKDEVAKCHLKCDAEAGRKIDCSNPNSEFYSIKCCDPKTQETVIITDPGEKIDTELACSGLGGAFGCDAGRVFNRVAGAPSLKECLCESLDNFNEKGFVKDETREACKDICPEGFIQDEKGVCLCPECKKDDGKKECPKGQERDPKTGKCIDKGGIGIGGGDNICPPGTGPSKTIQCICQKPAIPGDGECKCPEGTVYKGKDGCKKEDIISGESICPAGTGPSKTIPCKCKEPAKPIGIGNECTCEEGKVYAGEKGCINKEATEIPICEPGQFKSVIIPCKCAPGADFNEEGLCKCLNEKPYNVTGCGEITKPTPTPTPKPSLTPTPKTCEPNIIASVAKCTCAKGAITEADGRFCECLNGSTYSASGCLPAAKKCEPGIIPSIGKCDCVTGATVTSILGTCKCPTGQTYTKDGCTSTTCTKDQISTITIPCTCGGTAKAGSDGKCKCPSGQTYNGSTCVTTTTTITICTATEKSSSIGCACATGATVGSDGTCQCKAGETYTTDGCTSNFCSSNQVSSKDNPCVCKGTAKPIGPGGTCACSNGREYSVTFGGCGD